MGLDSYLAGQSVSCMSGWSVDWLLGSLLSWVRRCVVGLLAGWLGGSFSFFLYFSLSLSFVR